MSNANGRTSIFTAARMLHKYPWKVSGGGLTGVTLGLGVDALGWSDPAAVLVPGGLAAYGGASAWWWLRHVARPHATKTVIARRAELDQRSGGVASRLDIAEHAGPRALRLKALVLRPSLRGLNRRQRRRIRLTELGAEVARLGWGWWGERVYVACEDATLRIAGPRAGKTLSLACHGLDAPGAVITTSTRLDLAEMIHQTRSAKGRVHVFNPAGLGDLASTVRWRVLAGCEDFATAMRRAADLVPESSGEGERWDNQARRILAILLHAAALAGRSMRDVMRWIYDSTSDQALREIVDGLLSAPTGGRERAGAISSHWKTNDRTKSSITTTMMLPLAWMADDRARTLGDADPDDPNLLDVTALIERCETLHLIGHEDQTGLSPLIGALVAEIGHAARTLAAKKPGGRLDPPLTMLLDEAALVCPVPLDRWTADMGGRGVTLHICAQSLSQLRQRWDDNGAATIIANVTAFLWFGGSPSADDLKDVSLLTGEHRMKVTGADHRKDTDQDGEQRGEYRWVPVLSPAQIRALAPFQVLVLRRGLNTVVGWAPTTLSRKGWAPASLHPTAKDTTRVPSAAELEEMLEDNSRPEAQLPGPCPISRQPQADQGGAQA
jgi:type IV secretion system protein VirD4